VGVKALFGDLGEGAEAEYAGVVDECSRMMQG